MFTAGVSSTDEDEITMLMGGKNPGAEDLIGGAKKEEVEPKTTLDPKDKKDTEVKTEPKTLESKEEDVDIFLGEGDETKTDPKETKDSKKTEPKTTVPDNLEIDYQAIYNKMVEEGIWEEIDAPEGTEWNKETFIQIQKLQAEAKYDDLLDKTGNYGKAIIEFEKNGGNPSELLNLFREQKDIKDYDITSTEGQEEFLEAYYTSQNYSEKSIERTLKSLRDQGGDILKEEAEEKKNIWSSQYNEEIQARSQEQKLASEAAEAQQRKFHSTMEETITKDTEVTPKDRRELQSYILDYSQSYKGQKVSQFYLDMTEIQKDPKNYVELAKFVKGVKNGDYQNKIADKVKKETSANTFLKIKNGASLTKSTGNPDLQSKSTSSFISLLRGNK